MESNLRRDDDGDEIHGKEATTASSALSSWKPRKLPASGLKKNLLSFGGDDEQIALRVTTRKHNNEKDRVKSSSCPRKYRRCGDYGGDEIGGEDASAAAKVEDEPLPRVTWMYKKGKDRVESSSSSNQAIISRCGFYTAEELLEHIKEAHWYRLSHPEDPHPYQDEIDAMRAIKKNIRPPPLPPCTSVVTFNGVRMNSSFEKRASVIFCDENPTARSWMMDTLLPGISPSVDQ
ncbi:hypothetical protein ISN45_Aa06g007820 [Arabidopsis thaliana x Arabidopsis arenosa]|uniref:Uncharacterized protein n=1 Tax=Arabidopsis thaliana x Arabidopsis arenosa TaxID=1240361 RepID=A0A8T1YV00_9BRAS|nr:hypothetical protein ISN45_Aa06g007820 [Arabidopsis thaliana x Arabidopsis arenosa]